MAEDPSEAGLVEVVECFCLRTSNDGVGSNVQSTGHLTASSPQLESVMQVTGAKTKARIVSAVKTVKSKEQHVCT